MRARLMSLAAVAGLAVAALPAHAATTKPQVTDATGDANAINGQGEPASVPSQSTPADVSAADIVSVRFATTFVTKVVKGKKVKTATGMTATMTLAAAPTVPFINYRISTSAAGCSNLFFEYSTSPGGRGTDLRCPGAVPLVSTDTLYAVKSAVKGSTITWTVPIKSLPVGTTLSSLEADTRFNPVKLTVPAIDIATSGNTFTVGQ
ncbi:MAG: hypothetical protein QOF18_2157 [Frankiaceae bacterium]|nr:hypothetical protein [Frankiaceae bacterium]